MSSGLKKLLSFLFIALSITVVFFIAFSNEDLSNAFDAIRQMNLTSATASITGSISGDRDSNSVSDVL